MLPYSSQPFLDSQRIGKFSYLLELVDTNYDAFPFLLCYLLGQIENFLRRMGCRRNAKGERDVRIGFRTDRYLRY